MTNLVAKRLLTIIGCAILTPVVCFLLLYIIDNFISYSDNLASILGAISFFGGIILGTIIGFIIADIKFPFKKHNLITPLSETPTDFIQNQEEDIKQNKIYAVLCYVLGIFAFTWILYNNKRNSAFVIYHLKQSILLYALIFGSSVLVIFILLLPSIGIGMNEPPSMSITFILGILMLIISIFTTACFWYGITNAINGKKKPLPLIGKFAEKWNL